MRPMIIRTGIFQDKWSRAESERVLDLLLEFLTQVDMIFLRSRPDTPRLRDSGVRYYHDGRGVPRGLVDEYLSVDEALREGVADCKTLAAWRVAELRVSGEDPGARCAKRFAEVPDPDVGTLLLYHVIVQRSDGRTEDPSRELGMNVDEPDGYIPVPGVPWAVVHGMTNIIGAALLGNEQAHAQLAALGDRAARGDARARYLVEVGRLIRSKGYDPAHRRWARLPDARWSWVNGDAA